MRTATTLLILAAAASLAACASFTSGKGSAGKTADLYVKSLINKDEAAALKLNEYLAEHKARGGFIQQAWIDKSPRPVADNDPRLKLVKKNRQALKPQLAEMDNIVARSVYAAQCSTDVKKTEKQKNAAKGARIADIVMTCKVPAASEPVRRALSTVKLENTAALQQVIDQWKADVASGANVKTVEVPFQLYSDDNTPWSNPNIAGLVRPVTEAAAGLR